MFSIQELPLDPLSLGKSLSHSSAGAYVSFEGWIRDHNEGKPVKALEYEIYDELAVSEGNKILLEAREKFNLHKVSAIHRKGLLQNGECAVWVGATSSHRDDAFKATRFIIDQIKQRLPVWKKEHYINEPSRWVYCKHQHHVNLSPASYYEKQSKLVHQKKLSQAKVLVVGAGGLGCPVLVNLCSAGVGQITIVDFDHIEIHNIHRQFLYAPHLVGEKKVDVAAVKLRELNPFVKIQTFSEHVSLDHLQHDLVVDCTDNLSTKYFLHDACHLKDLPLVSASLYQNQGILRTFVPGEGCLRCSLEKGPDDVILGNCNDVGVLGAAANTLGSLQAFEAIEYLSSGKNSTITHTLLLDLKSMSQMKIKNHKRQGCETCAGKVNLLEVGFEVDSFERVLDIRELSDEEVLALKPQNVALACHKGVRSRVLTKTLRDQGLNVYSLRGGMCSR